VHELAQSSLINGQNVDLVHPSTLPACLGCVGQANLEGYNTSSFSNDFGKELCMLSEVAAHPQFARRILTFSLARPMQLRDYNGLSSNLLD